ncbi:bifunctional protein-disulfide isomerase/oxidoreductase DsbC [Alteromonas lipolytica]|uniref:Thiol:disulfide interchange protein n=1 Tax=Alteromonas lipolytica TaxID=1856405 RepID=A0A1E8FE58_9ALTE|nr:bifunctional protein-disulfide isomerase/oxidoreductase DsbC [Alteromonas lipolytica]OFI33763.1 thiol:disulfide interchange protein [Alteromonas lipolytica]GGF68609.1 thiol:disulfide interchange protein DsbC [Alteromonas lipolytica]
MKFFLRSLAVMLGLVTVTATANVLADAADKESVKSKIENTLQWKIDAIADSPVDGLLQINTENGLFYVSNDGTYLLQARIYNLDEQMRNETESALAQVRIDGLKQFDDSYIEFKAENEQYVVTVFTDTTCGYCRKLHEQIAQYNEDGITVRYLAYPRAGLNSPVYRQMVAVWCSDDPKKAMTSAKAGSNVTPASCANDVAEQFKFGRKIGVNGTPNIVLSDGSVIPGYQPPEQLLAALKQIAG